MKGRLAFVIGMAVGYVLGTRAGRERYEQMKRRAEAVWHTAPVQRGVAIVRDAVDERVDTVKDFAKRMGADVVSNIAQKAGGGSRPTESAGPSDTSATARTTAATKPEASTAPSSTAARDQEDESGKPGTTS